MRAIGPLLAAVLLAGCATTGARTPGDPYEKFNRAMWGFNMGVDKVVLKPASNVYRAVTPKPARRGISHVFANLSEPFSAINALLQGNAKRAFNSLGRFVVNTTIGIGGLADHASKIGLKPTPEDFGQTLAVWGVKRSAYLVLPILGPSTVRDGVGSVASQFIDPYRICLRDCEFLPKGVPTAINVMEVLSARSDLAEAGADDFLKTSADPYATARSAFFQRRDAAIANRDGDAAVSNSDDAAVNAALKEIDDRGAPQEPPPPPPAPTANEPPK
ncbi:MlaA family lipoprotein [Sphingomonas quercus]|uniref:VacJ family lipoprotein n=1 Tax=Sphingomonas quercus TaxID=2842451 RepID=A0ABS6BH59_9SPHN|nr:VacJ family lipoprotein [Sphingomonas quercus]MBU3077141.1 VacJ family lipoprotein [Sphingomonas quercus]